MTNLGEKISDAEFNQLVDGLVDFNSEIDINKFVEKCTSDADFEFNRN